MAKDLYLNDCYDFEFAQFSAQMNKMDCKQNYIAMQKVIEKATLA